MFSDKTFSLSLVYVINVEYVNGNQVYMHPGGYLLSQYDGGWHYQPTSPHTQPAKVSNMKVRGKKAH